MPKDVQHLKMRRRILTFKVLVPILLVLYTSVMVGIQLGIPNKEGSFTKAQLQGSSPVLKPLIQTEEDYQNHRGFFDDSLSDERPGSNLFKAYRKLQRNRHKFNQLELPDSEELLAQKNSSVKVGQISIFSIYHDNRPELSEPAIRVIGLKRFNSVESLICHFLASDGKWLKVHAHSYEMCENHGRYFGGWIFSCTIPREITESEPLKIFNEIKLSSTFVPQNFSVIAITKSTFTDEIVTSDLENIPFSHSNLNSKPKFGLCIPPLFGDISLSLLIQYIELSKVLGASKITFYKYSISSSIHKILNYYRRKGEVTLINWKLPPEVSEREIWYHGQLLAIQDCLYRNMANFDYLIFVDLDEFLVPVNKLLWTDMIEEVMATKHKDLNVAGFSFKSAFFDPKQVPDPSQQLTFLQLLQRNKILSSIRTKLMIVPRKVFELGIHHVSRPLQKNATIIEVDPSVAKIHHYRPCIINYDPDMKCYLDTKDDTLIKYSDKLVRNYQHVIRETIDLFMPDKSNK